jgi:hypothetical protein
MISRVITRLAPAVVALALISLIGAAVLMARLALLTDPIHGVVQPGCSAAVCRSSGERAAAFRDRQCLLGPRGALVVYGLAAEWWPEAVAGTASSDIP